VSHYPGVSHTFIEREILGLRDQGVEVETFSVRPCPPEELRTGSEELRRLVRERRPRVVAVAGITAYREAFGFPAATPGRQPEPLEGAELWVVPNPSGLNAHETIASLAAAYAEPARRAGVIA